MGHLDWAGTGAEERFGVEEVDFLVDGEGSGGDEGCGVVALVDVVGEFGGGIREGCECGVWERRGLS